MIAHALPRERTTSGLDERASEGARVSDIYVQYGCGQSTADGWLNFDASPTLRLQRIPVIGKLYSSTGPRFPANAFYGDIVKGLPIPPESCSGIYCSHVLEHLALEDCDRALANTRAYLRPQGIFRLVVPDLEQLARTYLAEDSSAAAHRFMESACLGRRQRPRGVSGLLRAWLGSSAHLWMWDVKSISAKLQEHGFTAIRRCAYGDSVDTRFGEVEEKDRFDGCLAMECTK